jgi:hypothetical protein
MSLLHDQLNNDRNKKLFDLKYLIKVDHDNYHHHLLDGYDYYHLLLDGYNVNV